MTIDATAYLITGIIYIILAVLAWILGKKLRDRCKNAKVKFLVCVVAFIVAALLTFFGVSALDKAEKDWKLERLFKTHQIDT